MPPHDADEPPFAEPWHAMLFALTHTLAASGRFDWSDWSAHFAAALKTAADAPAPNDATEYYEIWLMALEEFLIERELADAAGLGSLKQAWTDAYLATPHGQPVELADSPSST